MEQTFTVPDVSCGHCKSAIEGALKPLDGVHDANVDIEAKRVTVSYDEAVIGADRVTGAIEDAGYPVAS